MFIGLTIIILVITVLFSIQGFNNADFRSRMSFSPYEVKHRKKSIKLISHIFVHADFAHLAFNMFSFYMFGSMMEMELIFTYGLIGGLLHFAVIYFLGGLFATTWPMIRNHNNPSYTSLGASGAVSAMIFAAIIWNPNMELGLLFIPIPIKAYIFGPLYLAIEFWAFKRGKTNIAHDAHIGGAIFGIVYILIINIDKGKQLITLIFG